MTNNAEARAREVLAALVQDRRPVLAARLRSDQWQHQKIHAGYVIVAMVRYGNERAAQEREANAREVNRLASIARASPFWEDATADQLDELEARIANAFSSFAKAQGLRGQS